MPACLHKPYGDKASQLTQNMTNQHTEVAAAAEYEHYLRTVAFDHHKYGLHGLCEVSSTA